MVNAMNVAKAHSTYCVIEQILSHALSNTSTVHVHVH